MMRCFFSIYLSLFMYLSITLKKIDKQKNSFPLLFIDFHFLLIIIIIIIIMFRNVDITSCVFLVFCLLQFFSSKLLSSSNWNCQSRKSDDFVRPKAGLGRCEHHQRIQTRKCSSHGLEPVATDYC